MGGGFDDEDQAGGVIQGYDGSQNRGNDHGGDPARAFEDLRAEVSVMRRAVEALPGILMESLPPAPPDYRSDVGKVAQVLAAVVGRLDMIEKHPALRLTPEQHRQAIAREGNELMRDAAGKFQAATLEQNRARGELAGMIGTMRGRRDQVRIPMKSAMHSNLKPAIDSDLKPAGYSDLMSAT